jgi:hypothetical protein
MQDNDTDIVTPGIPVAISFLYSGQKVELIFVASDTKYHESYPDKLFISAKSFKGIKVDSPGGGSEEVTGAKFIEQLKGLGIQILGLALDASSDDAQVFT